MSTEEAMRAVAQHLREEQEAAAVEKLAEQLHSAYYNDHVMIPWPVCDAAVKLAWRRVAQRARDFST